MRRNSILAVVIGMAVISNSVSAQGEKKKPKSLEAVRGAIQYQLVKTNGSEIFIEQNMQDRSLPKVQETYTVMIPVQRVKEVDGKKVTVVEYVKEQRTRERYVMVRKSRPVPAGYRFKDIKGTDIPRKAMIGKLGMGTGKMLVQIFPGQKISTEFKSLLKDDVVFMIADQVPPPAAKGR